MKNSLIFYFFIFVIYVASSNSFAKISCQEKQSVNVMLDQSSRLSAQAISCKTVENNYKVYLHIYRNKILVKNLNFLGEGAYLLSVKNNIDIDLDGVFDLSISNGKGRGGDGMSYWLVKKTRPYLVFVGDFNELKISSQPKHGLFSILPGSGNSISTRIDYVFRNGEFLKSRVISYEAVAENIYQVNIEIPGRAVTVKKWSEAEAIRCMEGDEC